MVAVRSGRTGYNRCMNAGHVCRRARFEKFFLIDLSYPVSTRHVANRKRRTEVLSPGE